jgi:hypothetical protein
MKIILKTARGEFVKEAEILPFTEYPPVVIWGDRVFLLNTQEIGAKYYECFFAIVVDRENVNLRP